MPRIENKRFQKTVRSFLTTLTEKSQPREHWVEKGTETAGEFRKLCKAEGIQIYSTMSEIKVAFAERTERSLKNILYRYMEDYGCKYVPNLSEFVTTLKSR